MKKSEWSDLSARSQVSATAMADVCVIGAGAAGIYLTTQLLQRGYSVVLVEAGPATGVDSTVVGFDAVCALDPYPGATAGRFFGMGGSTTRWGGALVPHTVADLRSGGWGSEAWKSIVRVVADKTPAVLCALGYTNVLDFNGFAETSLGDTALALESAGLLVQSGLYLPYRRKNLVGLLASGPVRSCRLKVYFNAVAKAWALDAGAGSEAHVGSLIAVSRNGRELRVSARKFVICAGAIESARMLLELEDANTQPVLWKTARPGCYLGDHLSLPVADVVSGSRDRTAELFTPRFSGSWMRGFRFLDIKAPSSAPRAFAHFIFSNRSRGFELAKTLLGAMQRRQLPRVSAREAIGGMGDLAQLGYDRLVKSRLHVPSGTFAHLQIDMEQIPSGVNRVSLAAQFDDYGRRVAKIDWQVSDLDIEELAKSAERFLARWPGSKAGLPDLKARSITPHPDGGCVKPYDAYHPVGTCRMGDDEEAVVDQNLKVRGLSNLWLVSTGVLPSAGTANPTFTILCLAHELAERIQTAR